MYIYPSKYISWQFYNNSVYIMDERTELIRKLDYVAVTLWKLMQVTNSYDELVTRISEMLDMRKEEIKKSLDDFLNELLEFDIIEVLNERR